MKRMIAEGHIGNKGSKGGFYRHTGSGSGTGKQTLDFASFAYRAFDESKPDLALAAEEAGDFTLLLDTKDKYGAYAWEILGNTLCYAASLVPLVNGSLVAVDDAMKLGFNWLQGPFEMLDAIGTGSFVGRLREENRDVPPFLQTAEGRTFYRVENGALKYLCADGNYNELRRAPGVIRFSEERRKLEPLAENSKAGYFALPHDLGLVEFHSKANTLDAESMQILADATKHATQQFKGLVIHNDAQHFSCGANLETFLTMIRNADWSGLDAFLENYQQTLIAMQHAPIPVVAAPSGMSLGGGFEVVLHSDKVVFHANSVTGLVESVVGLVPGGGGVKEMLHRWYEHEGDIRKAAWNAFINIGYGKTASSPLEAEPLMMFRAGVDEFVMNRDRLLDTAMNAAQRLCSGYKPTKRKPLGMPGRDTWREMTGWLQDAYDKGRLTRHDVTTGAQIAMIVTGGDIDAGTELSEDQLCALERKAFVTLARTAETRARIEAMLRQGKPLRN